MSNARKKVIAITGASSGTGCANAKLLTQSGANVVLGARRTQKLEKIVEAIRAQGGTAKYKALDVTDRKDIKMILASPPMTNFAMMSYIMTAWCSIGGNSISNRTQTHLRREIMTIEPIDNRTLGCVDGCWSVSGSGLSRVSISKLFKPLIAASIFFLLSACQPEQSETDNADVQELTFASAERADKPAEATSPQSHPYVGMWVTEDSNIRHELLSNGRYDEARGARESAYQGRYQVTGDYLEP